MISHHTKITCDRCGKTEEAISGHVNADYINWFTMEKIRIVPSTCDIQTHFHFCTLKCAAEGISYEMHLRKEKWETFTSAEWEKS